MKIGRLVVIALEGKKFLTTEFSDRSKNILKWMFCLATFGVILTTGCQSHREEQAQHASLSSLNQFRDAVSRQDWKKAWGFSEQVLLLHGNDLDTLRTVARVAYLNERPVAAAGLLVDAAKLDQFNDPALVQQGTVALISVGRLFEALELLDRAVESQPAHHELRRLLFDFLVGVEDHKAAQIHGRELVFQRQFDFDLLMALCEVNGERELKNAPLDVCIERNPQDLRPKIGAAKREFDQGAIGQSQEILREILQRHPRYEPAMMLLGRSLVRSGDIDQLSEWAKSLSSDTEDHWEYWIILGDWARHHGHLEEAIRGYWEATERNPNVAEAWSKLGTALKASRNDGAEETERYLEYLQQRVALLNDLSSQTDRFRKSGRSSVPIANQISTILKELGRLWEAEAWAAMASTLPVDSTVSIEATRAAVLETLRSDTPWQVMRFSETLPIQFESLPKPSIAGLDTQRQIAESPLQGGPPSVRPTLINEAEQRGLQFFGYGREDLDSPGVLFYATLGCGGGAIDFDLDGWTDLYLMSGGGTVGNNDSKPNSLQRNLQEQFLEVSGKAGADDRGFGVGVATGDLNADGFADMLLLNYGPNRLLINNGDGTFRDVSGDNPVLQELRWSSSGAIADLDRDGLADVVIANYCSGLTPTTKKCENPKTKEFRACSPMVFPADRDSILKGLPSGNLQDVTDAWGFQIENVGRGLGVTVGELNERPGLDILIVNDMSNNHFWSQNSQHPFRMSESAVVCGLATDDFAQPQGSMGIASGDLDRDGDLDLFVTNFESEYNTLYQYENSGVWRDATRSQGLATEALPLVGFGTEAVDFDLDGNMELAVANGHIDVYEDQQGKSKYYQPFQLFKREASGRFELVREFPSNSYLGTRHVGRAVWTLDADRDGRLDLAVTHQTEPVALLMNRTKTLNHWLSIRVKGSSTSRDAIGTSITVSQGADQWTGFLTSGDGYLCSNERALHFGLGASDDEVAVTVKWPDGTIQEASALAVNQRWLIVQGQAPFSLSE